MNSSLRTSLLGTVAAVLVLAPATALADEPSGIDGEPWFPVPFRIRDLTFPTVLVMGFMPRPAEALEDGDWAIELNTSVSNNFQVSSGVGEQFLIDGEFGLFDLSLHYAVTAVRYRFLPAGSRSARSGALSRRRRTGGPAVRRPPCPRASRGSPLPARLQDRLRPRPTGRLLPGSCGSEQASGIAGEVKRADDAPGLDLEPRLRPWLGELPME